MEGGKWTSNNGCKMRLFLYCGGIVGSVLCYQYYDQFLGLVILIIGIGVGVIDREWQRWKDIK